MRYLLIGLILALFPGCSFLMPPKVQSGEVRIEKHDKTGAVEGGWFEVIVEPPQENK